MVDPIYHTAGQMSNDSVITSHGYCKFLVYSIAGVVSLAAGSIAGGTIADLKDHPFESVKGSVDASPEAEQDAFEQRLQQMEKVCRLHC